MTRPALAARRLGLLLSVALALGASARAEPGVEEHEILIGSCSSLSGAAQSGSRQLKGARAYLNALNDRGGVHGRRIRLATYDDAYNSDQAVSCFDRLVKEEVFAGAFFTGSPTGVKYAQMARVNKLPVLGLLSGAQRLRNPVNRYILNVRASSVEEEALAVGHLWNDLGIRKIGVIYQDDAFGVAVLRGVKRALRGRGAAVAAQGSVSLGADVSKAIRQVRAGAPEAVVVAVGGASVRAVLDKSRELGWSPLFQTTGGAAGLLEAGDAAENVVLTTVMPFVDRTDLPTVDSYRRLLEKYFPGEAPSMQGLEGFVDALVLAEGLKRAGRELDREKLVDALESLRDFDLGLGPDARLNFSGASHQGLNEVYAGVVRKGRLVPLKDWKTLRTP